MKILLYFENQNVMSISGIGRARRHQMMALESQGIEYTLDPFDDYDILHINTYLQNSESIIKKARKEGKPVIYHAHSTKEDFRDSFVFANAISPFFNKYLVDHYKMADEIITPTPYSKKLLESYGIDLPITAISNGIDLNRFYPDEEKVRAFYNYFGLSKEDKIVFSVGLLFDRKGIKDFFDVAKKLPQYKFIWFGTTPDLTITADVKKAIKERPFNVIMPGYVKGAVIEGCYQAADCFFFPSYEETEGIVVLEALASKANVLVRDIGVFDPWLTDKVNCYKGHNNDEFAELVEKIVEKKIPCLKEKGYKVAQSKSIEEIGKQLKEVYERVYRKAYGNEKAA